MIRFNTLCGSAALMAVFLAAPALAAPSATRPSVSENFAVGTAGSVCEAQGVAMGQTRRSVFDRKWMLLCRDLAQPVGSAYRLQGSGRTDLVGPETGEALTCTGARKEQVAGLGAVDVMDCTSRKTGLAWKALGYTRGNVRFMAQGLAAYESALRLALSSLVADRVQPGEVTAASLGSADEAALVRARAGVSDAGTVIGQGYRGNSAGAFAEAAELFAAAPGLLAPGDSDDAADRGALLHETKVNRALQLSNLGAFDQATRLFAEARAQALRDPVQARLARNFEAIDAINRGNLTGVAEILARPMPPVAAPDPADNGGVTIDRSLAAGLNSGESKTLAGVLGQETRLSPTERAAIIDAQALELQGTVLRLQGKHEAARAPLMRAQADALRVREGRVVSITRLRAQVLSELALTHEAQGNAGQAEALLREGLGLVESQYPDSASVNAARARLAGFLVRAGRKDEAATLYRQVVETVSGNRGALVGMANQMRPWFDLLAQRAGSDSAAAAELFLAGQLAERPGAADTLAQLSRQLEGGDDAASSLFRQSRDVTRALERTRIAMAQANAQAAASGQAVDISALELDRQRLQGEQTRLLSALSAYPQYRAVARRSATADDLRASLKPGEAYYKLSVIGGGVYATWVAPGQTRGWKLDLSAAELASAVSSLRDSISVTVNGVQSTYPFDVDAALKLHGALFGPVAGELAGVRHLVFEPDGAMLQLPLNLLTGDASGVAAYHARVDGGGDEYDFTGIKWLGRSASVSTALSASSFRDARSAPASKAPRAYLGLGQNQPLGSVVTLPVTRTGISSADEGCEWPVAAWNQPISAAELRDASAGLGRGGSDLMTGAGFTDNAVMARPDLAQFRVIHFATHGLVTAPREGCPARPALLTSFGGGASDGLLSFGEIFDLTLDADLVILSACNTAAEASLEATQEAGIAGGGGQALDGLVRAFIAAGGRDVIASHWPAPDEFGATRRLFSGFFADQGDGVGQALLGSQRALMDDPQTSHPFYWAGFAVIGDGARPMPGR